MLFLYDIYFTNETEMISAEVFTDIPDTFMAWHKHEPSISKFDWEYPQPTLAQNAPIILLDEVGPLPDVESETRI